MHLLRIEDYQNDNLSRPLIILIDQHHFADCHNGRLDAENAYVAVVGIVFALFMLQKEKMHGGARHAGSSVYWRLWT